MVQENNQPPNLVEKYRNGFDINRVWRSGNVRGLDPRVLSPILSTLTKDLISNIVGGWARGEAMR